MPLFSKFVSINTFWTKISKNSDSAICKLHKLFAQQKFHFLLEAEVRIYYDACISMFILPNMVNLCKRKLVDCVVDLISYALGKDWSQH